MPLAPAWGILKRKMRYSELEKSVGMVSPWEIITPEGIAKLVCADGHGCGKKRGKKRREEQAYLSAARSMGGRENGKTETKKEAKKAADETEETIGRDDPRWPFDPKTGRLLGGF